MVATCLMTNCRNKAPVDDAMCAKHRDIPKSWGSEHRMVPAPDSKRETYLAGYRSGFYAAGNYFPEESWRRYLERMGCEDYKRA